MPSIAEPVSRSARTNDHQPNILFNVILIHSGKVNMTRNLAADDP